MTYWSAYDEFLEDISDSKNIINENNYLGDEEEEEEEDDDDFFFYYKSQNENDNNSKSYNKKKKRFQRSPKESNKQSNSNNTPSSTIYVTDLPINKDSKCCAYDEYFLRCIFDDQGVSKEYDAVTIKTQLGRNNKPYSYAFIKFDTHEQALKAIKELNYTKLDNVPIRLMMADEETKNIIQGESGKILVKNLDQNVEISQLHDTFANFGEIITCKIRTKLVSKDGEKSYVSRGYGYVQFRHPEDAQKAITNFQNKPINGRPVKIEPFQISKHIKPNTESTFINCYIKNIPPNYKDSDLEKLFHEYGTPTSCKVVTDKNGVSKQIGFCSMSTHEEAIKATEGLNGRKIDGFTIRCGRKMSKKELNKFLEELSKRIIRSTYEKYKGRMLFVKDFDENVTDDELKNIFSQFGEVEFAKIMRYKDGYSKKIGFVCFRTSEQAEDCIKQSTLLVVNEKPLFVENAMTGEQLEKRIKQKERDSKFQMPMNMNPFPFNQNYSPNTPFNLNNPLFNPQQSNIKNMQIEQDIAVDDFLFEIDDGIKFEDEYNDINNYENDFKYEIDLMTNMNIDANDFLDECDALNDFHFHRVSKKNSLIIFLQK